MTLGSKALYHSIKTSWPPVLCWVEGKLVFLQEAWFFPYALGTGDAIMWVLLRLLQALRFALLPELLTCLLSNVFRPNELSLFELQVFCSPMLASEQLYEWFRYCSPLVCYHLWVCLCLEKDVAVPVAQVPTGCLGTLKDGFGPACCRGKVDCVVANRNTMRMTQIHLPAFP